MRSREGNTGKVKAMDGVRPRLKERIRDRFAVGNRLKGRVREALALEQGPVFG